jgi:putative methyltransferase (TIGR04325 family)
MNSPIALFVYARPDHTRRTVESLSRNPEAADSDLIIFSDAAQTTDKEEAVKRVRDYVAGIEGFRSLTIHHRSENFGLAKSIIEGVTQVLIEHERVIVLEDDMETSPYFLRYMNEALGRYANDESVISVHGYVYPTELTLPETFFLRGADCWGWATWRRGWAYFNPDGQFLLKELKRQRLLKVFNFNGAYSYSGMLQGQINGTNDSWAVRWHASAFLANKLTLYPGRSVVHNIGNDSSGTHCGTSPALDAKLSDIPIRLNSIAVEESDVAKKAFEHFFRANLSPIRRFCARFMQENIRHRLAALAKEWLPPVLVRQLQSVSWLGVAITFEGPFASWQEAEQLSSGYDNVQILDKVLAATLKVKRGEAVFERDSALFDEIQYAWPLTAGLMWAAACNKGLLRVLDFGGSLGSSYFQNRKFLEGLQYLRWSIVEQTHFVEAGREHIQDKRLVFYPTIAECVAVEKPNVLLLSAVLQYLSDPYTVLDELLSSGVEIVLVDRASFSTESENDIFKVQITPANIYSSRYPIRYFGYKKFIEYFRMKGFQKVEEFSSLDNLDQIAMWRGFVFKKSSNL